MNMTDELKAARESQCFMAAEIAKLKGQLADALEETDGYRAENMQLRDEIHDMKCIDAQRTETWVAEYPHREALRKIRDSADTDFPRLDAQAMREIARRAIGGAK